MACLINKLKNLNNAIANYHYFREQKLKTGIFPLTLKEFESQIEMIGRYYDFVSEADIIDIL